MCFLLERPHFLRPFVFFAYTPSDPTPPRFAVKLETTMQSQHEVTMQSQHEEFLIKAAATARAAGHIWPDYAACEVALESAWGASTLALKANNLFGQKQFHPPYHGTGTITLPTKEFLHGDWIEVQAAWMSFPDWGASCRVRMEVLHRLAREYPGYARALAATDGETFIREVSAVWSTGPRRAVEVLAIHARYQKLFNQE